MSANTRTANRSQSGFTLVELAVVMIIIGLLIGGVLKGQELINNAQITSTVAQVKAYDAAVSTFEDMYAALPGDMLTPGTRLPNCGAPPCSTAGSGNRALTNPINGAPAGENLQFFVHLSAADLVTGINAGSGVAWGGQFPEANINGGFHVGSTSAGAVADFSNALGANIFNPGIYLGLVLTANAAPAASLTPNQAFRIDNKVDDGIPGTGSVRAGGTATCGTATAYAEAQPGQNCTLYIRIQG